MSTVSIIAAIAANGVIGRNNDLPWHLPEDLKRFRALTMGHHIIMGRKTYESLGRLLPGRTTVIVSRNVDYRVEGAIVVPTLAQAIAACHDDPEVFVIGGAQLYRDALPVADKLYLTELQDSFEGDVRFPEYDRTGWQQELREEHVSAQELEFSYANYRRI